MERLTSAHNPYYYSHPPPPGVAVPPPPPPPPPQLALPPPPLHPQAYYEYHHHDAYYGLALGDQVRTLFIAGLPDDTKPREIYNLFRDFPGYESSQLRRNEKTNQAFAFAVFTDQQSAVVAMHALNGLTFDLERDSALHIELAKSNSRSQRQRTDDSGPGFGQKGRGAAASSQPFFDSGFRSNIHLTGMGNSAHNTIGYPSTQSQPFIDYEGFGSIENRKNYVAAYVPQNNTPCRTLYVANLGPRCSEQELIQVFSRCPGYLKLKMRRKHGDPEAFVDFKDEACSTGALNHLQGFLLHSSNGEGMRLAYAKAEMGTRKRERP